MALVRLLAKPVEVSGGGSSWVIQQLPDEELAFLHQARFDLLVPVALKQDRSEAFFALGPKRSEEPYGDEDQELLVAIATSLALLLERPGRDIPQDSEAFEECSRCGQCYEPGVGQCRVDGGPLSRVPLPRLLTGRYRFERRR